MDDQAPTALQTVAAIAVGVGGASISSLDRKVTIRQSLWHSALAGFLAGIGVHFIKGMWPASPWYMSLLPIGLTGLCIYGIAVALRSSDKTIERLDPSAVVKNTTGLDLSPKVEEKK